MSIKAVAVVPCLNESESISDLVFKMNQLVDLTVVADDNSIDGTAEVAEKAGAYVVRNFGKRGFGDNCKSGIAEAMIRDCDIVVTLDGDGQHNPSEYPAIIKPIEAGEADVVIGSRFLRRQDDIPRYRRVGIKIITWLCNVGAKQKFTDSQCCFRAYKSEVLKAMTLKESGFTFSTEILIKARAMGYRIKEVPVAVFYHKELSKNSTLNPIKQGLLVSIGTVKVRLKVEVIDKIARMFRRQNCLSSGL